MKSSRRDRLNDMAEHRLISKNNQNTYYPRFGFTPKTGRAYSIPQNGFFCVPLVKSLAELTKVQDIERYGTNNL